MPFAGLPYGAMPDDTAEFMLGEVYVNVVLMESSTQTGPTNNNSENWTPDTIAAVKRQVSEGLQWWEDTLAGISTRHELNFQIDFTYADSPVSTSYEPITRPSTDVQFWIYDFLNRVGYNTRGNYHSDIKAFNHAQRVAHNTDWAFTIFVVNDERDADKFFAPGGFSRAFAFAGGEFLVSLASRPASTYAHETGHIFWAYDEYRPDGNYERRRGYYNTQNLNSWDNPTPGFVQQPSIMTRDQLLSTAYTNHTSATSTLEMIGWRDSDGDGIFDVLDVPLSLTGSGYYDAATGEYRFTGAAAVQTLPNRNSSGLKNDITLNEISRAEYRIDGGAWQTASTYNTATAILDLRVPVPATATTFELRVKDDAIGVTSETYVATLQRPESMAIPGVRGVVWRDVDGDGLLDTTETGLANVTVQVVDDQGTPLSLKKVIEPDNYESTARLNTVDPAVTLTAIGTGVSDTTVASLTSSLTSTGDQLFASFSSACGGYCSDWTTDSRQLRIDFTSSVATLSLDAVGSTVPGIGRLEVYAADNQLLGRYTTAQLAAGRSETMTINRPTADIKYAIARSHSNTVIRFDQLRVGPEAKARTDSFGNFVLGYLGPGTYRLQVVPGANQSPTNPQTGLRVVTLGNGEALGGIDFGLQSAASPWQNPRDRYDVNNDGLITPNDVLRIINKLNNEGAGELGTEDGTPPFVDVNGDRLVTSNDVLQLINEINRRNSGGEAAGGPALVNNADQSGSGAEAELVEIADRESPDAQVELVVSEITPTSLFAPPTRQSRALWWRLTDELVGPREQLALDDALLETLAADSWSTAFPEAS